MRVSFKSLLRTRTRAWTRTIILTISAGDTYTISRAAGMDDFPIWVQLLPKVLFNVIVAREGVDFISKESLKQFYEKFVGLKGQTLESTTEQGFKTATAVSI